MTFDATFPPDFYARRAQLDPDGLCWVCGDRSWTWGEAWDDIRRFAGALLNEGVIRGDRIAFLDDISPSILVAMQAACLIGASDVVLDPRLASDEIAHALNDSRARMLFVGHQHLPAVEVIRDELGPVGLVVVGGQHDELEPWIAGGPLTDRQFDVTLDDPCLVLYSSGTTGRPKGIVLTQHNMMVHTRSVIGATAYDIGGMFLFATLMFHGYALIAAATGSSGVVITALTAEQLTGALEAGMTHAVVTPAALARLQRAGPATMELFSRLTSVTYGAAPVSPSVLSTALKAWPNTRFSQIYGMTEMVSALTVLDDDAHHDTNHPERLLSCGRPIAGVEMRVIDPINLEDVGRGSPGELCFRSEQTTPGYLGDAEATAALILDGGWVRTGDIGRVDDDGFVFVQDRVKDVIIVNGYNVFSSEVERVLADHPSVVESAVIGVPGGVLGGESVKAVVVFHPEQAVAADELAAFVCERLAAFKAPTSVDVATSLPRNPLGKVVKRALRDPYWAGRERQI